MTARKIKVVLLLLLVIIFSVGTLKAQDSRAYAKEDVPLSHSLEAKSPTEAWKEVEKAGEHFPSSSHSESSGILPVGEPRTRYIESWLVATADKAQEFYTKFPNDTNAVAAREKELDVLCEALDETYSTNLVPRIFTQATLLFKDDHVDKSKRLEVCNFIFFTALTRGNLLPPTVNIPTELREDARILEKDFKDLADFHRALWLVEDSEHGKTRPLFREFTNISGMPGFAFGIVMTTPILLRMAIDTPYALAFTAVDGRTVDTAKMKGKVVAIDFWGTEYPECITNVLHLQKLYNKLHTNGLEVIGVNVDQNSDTLKTFVSDHGIEWPQSWDADVILKKIVPALVTRAGTILLVDKKGMLHDIYGDEDLDRKIEALLKE